MGTGYTRNDTTNNIADGNVINAADLDGEFDAIVTALSTGGHSHDGTAAEGGPVTVLGPAQDFVVSASIVSPKTDNTLDLGTSTLEFKDLYLDGTAHIDSLDVDENANIDGNLTVGGNVTVTGTTTFNGGTIRLGDAASDNVVFGADVDSSIIPNGANGSFDLGSSSQEWRDLFINGTAHIDTLDVDVNATVAGTLGVTGIATFTDDIIIGDGKTIGSASDVDAISISAGGVVNVSATTASTSSTSGALTVGGGLGVAAKLFVGTDLDVNGTANLDIVDIDGAVDMATTLAVAGNVDFNGDLDVDGTTNLDVVDIDGAVDMASTLAVTGIATFTDDIIIGDGKTIGSASDVDAIAIGADGDVTLTQDLELQHDGAILSFGANDEITVTHVADRGLTITNTNAGDDKPVVLQLKSEEDIMQANELIASIEFAAGDSDGTDGSTIAAGIHAIAEDDFSASSNLTKFVFTTGVSETAAFGATAKMTLSSAGLLTIADDFMIKDGGTIGVASTAGAITIASDGDTTFNADVNVGANFDVTGDAVIDGTLTQTGNATFAGILDITLATDASDATGDTGALRTEGGASIAKKLFVGTDFDVSGNAVIDGTTLATGILTATAKTVFNGGFGLPDSQKATFGGTGTGDLQIYHDGSDSIIADVGTGNLKLLGNDMRINNADSSQSYFFAANGGAASICHAGNTKIATASGGVTVTGEMAATTMDLSSNAVIDGTALVTGVLTTTAATVFNGGFAANQESTIIAADGAADNAFALIVKNEEATDDRSFGLKINAGSTATDTPFFIKTHDDGTELFGVRGSGQVRFVDGTASLPAISNIGDVNTGIFFPAADKIGLVTGGVERIRINDIGGVSVTSTAGGHFVVNEGDVDSDFRVESEINTHMLFVDGGDDYVSIGSADQNNGGALNINAVSGSAVSTLTCRSATDAHTNIFTMLKTPATSGNYTATASGDILGDIRFMGVNTSAVADIGAQIVVEQTGTASGTVPAQMSFVTNEATAMSINSAGKIGMGATGTNIDADLHVVGTVLVGTAAANTTIDDSLSTGLDVAVGSGTKAFQVWDDGNTTTPRLSVLRNGTLKSSVAGGFFETRTDGGGFIYKQLLDVATAGVTFSGQSTRGELGQVRILQTAEGADGGYIELKTSPSGSTTPALRVTVDAAGNVGIGTGAPSGYLATQLVVAAPDEGGITLAASATSHKQNIFFADGTSGSARNRGNLSYDHNNDSLSMGTAGGNARFLMDNTGAATIANGLTLTDGNLVVGTAGKGINFSAYGSGASIDNNLLNDYEEGTFAPAYAASGTAFGAIVHNTQVGNYTKVGNLVTISIALRTGSYTAGSTDGIVTITGLPFTSGGTDTYPIAINAQDAWTNFMPYQGWVANTTVTLTNNSGGSDRTGYRTVPVANMTAGANKNRIYLMGTYTTTS